MGGAIASLKAAFAVFAFSFLFKHFRYVGIVPADILT